MFVDAFPLVQRATLNEANSNANPKSKPWYVGHQWKRIFEMSPYTPQARVHDTQRGSYSRDDVGRVELSCILTLSLSLSPGLNPFNLSSCQC